MIVSKHARRPLSGAARERVRLIDRICVSFWNHGFHFADVKMLHPRWETFFELFALGEINFVGVLVLTNRSTSFHAELIWQFCSVAAAMDGGGNFTKRFFAHRCLNYRPGGRWSAGRIGLRNLPCIWGVVNETDRLEDIWACVDGEETFLLF